MKTDKEIIEMRDTTKEQLINAEKMESIKYYQGVIRTLDWILLDETQK